MEHSSQTSLYNSESRVLIAELSEPPQEHQMFFTELERAWHFFCAELFLFGFFKRKLAVFYTEQCLPSYLAEAYSKLEGKSQNYEFTQLFIP